jgi:endonuclease G
MRSRSVVALACLAFISLTPTRAHTSRSTASARSPSHCYRGCPQIDSKWVKGDLIDIRRGAYELVVSSDTKIPFWVAEYVTAAEVEGDAGRGGYRADPVLRNFPHATLADYRDNDVKYDVGHQAPAANHARSQARMDQTFYLSNMAPQVPAFNRGIWRGLEMRIRKWVHDRGAVYSITGPMFWRESNPASPAYKPPRIGKNGVAVPTHFYKILIAPASGSRPAETLALVIPNRAYVAPYEYDDFIHSIDWVEGHTGINFMPELTKDQAAGLEKAKAPAVW